MEVSSDLTVRNIETFDELFSYCYQVASVVGLTIVHIFGFKYPPAMMLAKKCGITFQLTNIIRDVREDYELGRRYIPAEDLRQFGANVEQMENSVARVAMLRHEAARARQYYEESRPLVVLVDARALIEIYWRLFLRIEVSGFDVFERRIRLTAWEKVKVIVEAYFTK